MTNLQTNIIVLLLVVVNCGVYDHLCDNPVDAVPTEVIEKRFTYNTLAQHINTCYSIKLWKRRRRDLVRVKRRPIEFETTEEFDTEPQTKESVYVKFKRKWPVYLWKHYGMFSEDYLLSINEHWLGWPPPAPALHYSLAGVYIALAVVGCTGNVVVILMYIRCRSLRTPGNILVANLALSDFLMLAKTPIFIVNSFHLGPVLGRTGCVIYGFVGGLSGTTSIATLTAIALDRYWAVVYPLQPLRALTAIRARLLALGSWLYAAVFATIPALDVGYGRYVPEGFLTSCSFDYLTDELKPRYFIFVFFCAGWLAPLCIISYCYSVILRIVVGQRNMSNKNQEQRMSSRHVKEQTKRKAEVKLAVLVIVVIALFFVSWTPYAVVALLGIFGQKHLITPTTSMIPALFCKTAACINPFIYIITHPKFRKELQKLLFKDKSRRMGGTVRTIGYTESNKIRRPSRDLSETDVEVIEMKDIPYQNPGAAYSAAPVRTVSEHVAGRTGSQRSHTSVSMKSFEESVVTPPSWYSKPQFSKKRSFSRSSSKKSF
ncbi:opsin, ultraviolet-sensitive-like isoform X1 [Aricia agestis]|uniref:opsin, ultraviolet-sensitive-like isoform X1 n=1 Tax=Aricia agestis TaxID=91739 RepID=UPI001C2033B6|nr:opsin, ultraviolet-sensitive-like isoform X1 [Aricia agestis]